jgi:hypothetical protein
MKNSYCNTDHILGTTQMQLLSCRHTYPYSHTKESTVLCGTRFTGPKTILDMLAKRNTPREPEIEFQLSIIYPVFTHVHVAKSG